MFLFVCLCLFNVCVNDSVILVCLCEQYIVYVELSLVGERQRAFFGQLFVSLSHSSSVLCPPLLTFLSLLLLLDDLDVIRRGGGEAGRQTGGLIGGQAGGQALLLLLLLLLLLAQVLAPVLFLYGLLPHLVVLRQMLHDVAEQPAPTLPSLWKATHHYHYHHHHHNQHHNPTGFI